MKRIVAVSYVAPLSSHQEPGTITDGGLDFTFELANENDAAVRRLIDDLVPAACGRGMLSVASSSIVTSVLIQVAMISTSSGLL